MANLTSTGVVPQGYAATKTTGSSIQEAGSSEIIDAEFDDTTPVPSPITDESVTQAAQQAGAGIGPILLIGAVGFGLYLAFRR